MLFTVTATFSDFTAAYEQHEAETPEEALRQFLVTAEALESYSAVKRDEIATADGFILIHRADGLRGIWSWHLTQTLEQADEAVYGGLVIQTDPKAPVRTTGNGDA
jgi:uncharacterized protein YukJ